MGFFHVVVAVLGLLSVGQSAPVTSCESLIQPLDIQGRDQLLGEWMQVAESTDSRKTELLRKTFLDGYWSKITAANESDAVTIMGTSKMFGFCLSTTSKMTVENSTLQPAVTNMTLTHNPQGPVLIYHNSNLLKTGCSDCLLVKSQNLIWGTHTVLQLLSKRRAVTAAELHEFKKQAECLNLPPPFTLNPEGDVCPEPPETDEPHLFLNGESMEFINAAEKIVNSFGGPEKFINMVTETVSKQD